MEHLRAASSNGWVLINVESGIDSDYFFFWPRQAKKLPSNVRKIAQIKITLSMCKVSTGPLLSIHTFLLYTFILITKTRLLKYIENFTTKKNSYIFLISSQNINCGYSLEPPQRGGSNE